MTNKPGIIEIFIKDPHDIIEDIRGFESVAQADVLDRETIIIRPTEDCTEAGFIDEKNNLTAKFTWVNFYKQYRYTGNEPSKEKGIKKRQKIAILKGQVKGLNELVEQLKKDLVKERARSKTLSRIDAALCNGAELLKDDTRISTRLPDGSPVDGYRVVCGDKEIATVGTLESAMKVFWAHVHYLKNIKDIKTEDNIKKEKKYNG
ncbi:MAG: hypothetical protein GY928_33825 [Colwellia sp.]|nr:hypothetical protein [Colwellia sp.]